MKNENENSDFNSNIKYNEYLCFIVPEYNNLFKKNLYTEICSDNE